MVNQLKEKPVVAQDMLRTRFWVGLVNADLKNATRYHFHSGTEFDVLFGAVRSAKHDLSQSVKRSGAKIKTASQSLTEEVKAKDDVLVQMSKLSDQMTGVVNTVKDIDKRLRKLECNKQPVRKRAGKHSPQKKTPVCDRCGRRGHAKSDCVAKIHIKGYPLKGQAPTSEGRQ